MAELARLNNKRQTSYQEKHNSLPVSSVKNDCRNSSFFEYQKTMGNQAVQNLLNTGVIQSKLKISSPNDKYEQEADRVADMVLRMPNHTNLQQVPSKRRTLGKSQTVTSSVGQSADIPDSIKAVVSSGGGRPLDSPTQELMEARLGGEDFSQVRVHTDLQAVESAREVNAHAYTVGREIVFGAGQYAPQTAEGRHLIAHELAHVVQQKRGVEAVQATPNREGNSEQETEEKNCQNFLRVQVRVEQEEAKKQLLKELVDGQIITRFATKGCCNYVGVRGKLAPGKRFEEFGKGIYVDIKPSLRADFGVVWDICNNKRYWDGNVSVEYKAEVSLKKLLEGRSDQKSKDILEKLGGRDVIGFGAVIGGVHLEPIEGEGNRLKAIGYGKGRFGIAYKLGAIKISAVVDIVKCEFWEGIFSIDFQKKTVKMEKSEWKADCSIPDGEVLWDSLRLEVSGPQQRLLPRPRQGGPILEMPQEFSEPSESPTEKLKKYLPF